MKKVVVTGATSMLGVALIKRLLQEEKVDRVYAVVRSSESDFNKRLRIPIDARVRIIECDMGDYCNLSVLINDACDIFYHMVWPRTETYKEELMDIQLKCDAVKCVIEALHAAKTLGCTKFVGIGSQSEYGIPEDGYYYEDMQCDPVRADGILHLAANRIANIIAKDIGIVCLWMRVFSVYGIYDRESSMINNTIDKLINKEHCSFTKSEQLWDFVHTDDAAEAFYIVAEKANESTVYNVASGEAKPLIEYINIIRDVVNSEAKLGIGELAYPANPVMKMVVDVSKLRSMGWRPRKEFKQGIKEIYANRKTRWLEYNQED